MASSGEGGDCWDPIGKKVCYETPESQTQNICSSYTCMSTKKEDNDYGPQIAQTSETDVSSDTTKDKIQECQDETPESQSQNVCSSNTSTEKECNDYGPQIAQTSETDVSSDTTKDKIQECQAGRTRAQRVVTTSFYAPKNVEREELEDNKDEIRMLIAGKRGVGKSALANSIAGEHMQESKSNHGTVTQNSAKLKCKRRELSLTYFDTPGLSFDLDEETAQKEYRKCLITAAPGLHAILIVQKATEYTSSNQAFLDTCTKIFGENCWKNVIFVFTHIDELKRDFKGQIEDADESLKRYLSKCGNRYVEINNNLKGTRNDQQINVLLSAVKDLMKTNNGEIYTNVEFQEIYKRMQIAARDRNLTLSEVREKIFNTMASKKVITGVWKGFIKECFNMHV